MAATSLRIGNYLGTHPAATTEDLSHALDCTPANIRYHLGRMMARGEIQVVSRQASSGKGRPTLFYGLCPAAQENNLVELAGVLLEGASESHPEGESSRLESAAVRMAGPLPLSGQHLTRRLATAIYRLNELTYHARWEAHAGGPRVYLAHCPYAALLPGHAAAACRFDACLLSALLGVPMKQVTHFTERPCVFAAAPGAA
jgi:predicted ArsR family transcriptional regulator